MNLTLSAPSKTFLAGEYAVLAQGPALVLATSPRFELRVRFGSGQVTGIPPLSPAAKWLEQRRPLLSEFDVEFHDPHNGAGGLGASGAQFLLTHCLTTFLQSGFAKVLHGPDLKDVWNDYQVLSQGSGSGADVLAQTVGGVAHIEMGTLTAERKSWPYPELGWTVVRTHQKIPTHEHLSHLDRTALSLLTPPAIDCVEAFGHAAPEIFVKNLKIFALRLKDLGLQAAHALSLVKLLENEDWCLMAKGCGALGADTVLFFYPVQEREKVAAFLRKTSLHAVATHSDLGGGLEMKWH
jgi:mevalonate kinase